ncbi:hypothetical protein [Rubritalea tangerina]
MEIDGDCHTLRSAGKYGRLIEVVREAVELDRVAVQRSWQYKKWCAERWKNLFISEAVRDEAALAVAKKKYGKQSDRAAVALRFLRETDAAFADVEMPACEFSSLRETRFIFCPGLLNGLLPVRAFQRALPELERDGLCQVLRADLHPLAGCESNAEHLARAIELGVGLSADRELVDEKAAQEPKNVILFGYSKGVADILTLLVKRPDLASRIKCIFSWAGAAGGSYIADDVYSVLSGVEEDPDLLDKAIASMAPFTKLPEIVQRRKDETEIKLALRDLTTMWRRQFMLEHERLINDLGIPIFNLSGSTSAMEVPSFQFQGAMRLNKIDGNNDMQVTQDQSRIQMPMATDLAMLHAHHWDMSYDSFPKAIRMSSPHLDHPFPKKAALLASIQLAYELGLAS